MNTRLTTRRPGRAVAVVGAVVAVSATTLMALAATASAAGSGRCTQNVNVRAEPKTDARIVALCEAGKQVQVGETRNGFVRLSELNGWASQEYVSVNGAAPARSPRSPGASSTSDPDESMAPARRSRPGHRSEPSSDPSAASDPSDSSAPADGTDPTDETDPAADPDVPADAPAERAAPRSPLGGLLGGS